MKLLKNKTHRGYLLIISAVIIVIIAGVATLTLEMFTGGAKSTENVAQSTAAFYLATSSLQVAKRDIIVNKVGCVSINGLPLYTNASITGLQGQYTIDSCYSKNTAKLNAGVGASDPTIPLKNFSDASSNLSSAITSSSTSITLADASSFRSSGTAKIDNEYISYTNKSLNTLQNITRGVAGTATSSHNQNATVTQGFLNAGVVKIDDELIGYNGIIGATLQNVLRGVGGTTKASHAMGAKVKQNQCTLTSVAGLPDLSVSQGKRTVQEYLFYDNDSFLFSNYEPTLVSTGSVHLTHNGAQVRNLEIASTDSNWIGSTILTSDDSVILNDGAKTILQDGTSSTSSNPLKDDIVKSATFINSSNLFGYVFNQSFTNIMNAVQINYGVSNLASNLSNSNNAGKIVRVYNNGNTIKIGSSSTITTGTGEQPKILIFDGNFSDSGNVTIGTPTAPTVLIINGDARIYNNFKLYGILYVKGKLKVSVSAGGEEHDDDDDDDDHDDDDDDEEGHDNSLEYFLVDGFAAAEGRVHINARSNSGEHDGEHSSADNGIINKNSSFLSTLKSSNEYLIPNLNSTPLLPQEIFY